MTQKCRWKFFEDSKLKKFLKWLKWKVNIFIGIKNIFNHIFYDGFLGCCSKDYSMEEVTYQAK